MESYLISDNEETLIGMKMAGISGELLTENHEILARIDELILDPKIGIVILTHKTKEKIEEEVMIRKLQSRETLIIEIPGPNESIKKDFITKYIRESIGLKL
ncbi:MAG: V-type ATP synthase subunit F [Clostridiales bacterium]|nr:V-type ATP synthase subunit F [Clostridiales bacterium]